jgi:hypothetical protein
MRRTRCGLSGSRDFGWRTSSGISVSAQIAPTLPVTGSTMPLM